MQANTFAEVVDGWVKAGFPNAPRFVRRRRKDGEFEAFVRAPKGSKAGHLITGTYHGDLWVRFAQPNMSYPIDDRQQLLLVVRHLLKDRALFAVTYRGDAFQAVTLILNGKTPKARRGEVVQVVSWSGRFDATVSRPAPSGTAR